MNGTDGFGGALAEFFATAVVVEGFPWRSETPKTDLPVAWNFKMGYTGFKLKCMLQK